MALVLMLLLVLLINEANTSPTSKERAAPDKPVEVDRKLSDLPTSKEASVERAADKPGRKLPNLPPPKKASVERAADKPGRKLPDLPPPKKASVERAADKSERLPRKLPDLPPPRKASVERAADKPGRELPNWKSVIIDGFYMDEIPDEHLRAAVISDLKKKWLAEEKEYTHTHGKKIHLFKRVDVTSICTTKSCMDLMIKYAKWKAEHDDGSGAPSGRWG